MKAKGLIIALAVLVLAVAAYFVVTGLVNKAEADAEAEKTAGCLIDAAPEDIDQIVYNYAGSTYEFVLDSDGETWLYPADPEFPLKQRLIKKMANYVEKFIVVQEVADGAANLAQYGLDQPQCVLSIHASDGRSYQFNIGNYTDLPRGYYVQPTGTETVYIVKSDIDCYLLGLFDLAVQDSTFAFTRFPDGNPDYYNPNIQWFQDNAEGILIAGDSVKLREFITNVDGLEVKRCALYPYSEADLSAFGLENGGRASYTIQYTDEKSGEACSYTLEIGNPEEDREGYYTYIHLVGSDLICTVKTEDLENFVFPGNDSFLSKDVCVVNYEDILEMDLTIDGESYRFTSTKEESVDQFGYDVTLSTFYLDGEEIDGEYFRVLQSGFSSIDTEAFADDGDDFDNVAPYIRIVYTTDTLDHAVLEFVPYNANFYLARFGGRNDMLVGRQSLRIAASRLENLLNSQTGTDAPAADSAA